MQRQLKTVQENPTQFNLRLLRGIIALPRFNKKQGSVDDMEKYYKPFKFEKNLTLKDQETGADEAKIIKAADRGPIDQYAGPIQPVEPVLPPPYPTVKYTPKAQLV